MRLIDADVFKAKLLAERDAIPKTLTERYGFERQNNFGNAMRGGIRKALRCMEQTPTIDAVPVVFCDDCKHHERCMAERIYRSENIEKPYCCRGERNEN